jgi:predicted translin family RNA/ssDNA-binding protein
MSLATEIINAIINAEQNIDEQINLLNEFVRQTEDIMSEISQAIAESTQDSAKNMLNSISQTKTEIMQTIDILQSSKEYLMRARQI